MSFHALKPLGKIVPSLIVLSALGAGWLAIHELGQTVTVHEESEPDEGAVVGESIPQTLVLPDGKIANGDFQIAAVELHTLQHVHVVPGRVQYDELHHIEIKSPLAGTLDEILVKPGDHVAKGQLLAKLISPQIGEARSEVLECQAQLELAERRYEREKSIATNLADYFSQLDSGLPMDSLDQHFAERPLGSYRQQVEAAYSRLMLARELYQNVKPLGESGSISGKTIRERQAELQVARVEFSASRDQARFASSQSLREAAAEKANAERRLKIAHQKLESLLGYKEERVALDSQQQLSVAEIRAPFAGTIEERFKAESERVLAFEMLFILADTGSLYIAADVRENDWAAVNLSAGVSVQVTVPALSNRQFEAIVHYVSREVTLDSNAVQIIARIDNKTGLLRPGMFVRVALPVGPETRAIAVPQQAVMRDEGEQFVFIAQGQGRFQKQDVATGIDSENWIEITAGLKSGQRVVTDGAFLLKSEFLLQGEAD